MSPPAESKEKFRGPIAWMVNNPIAAHFLLLIFLIGGYYCAREAQVEILPDIKFDRISITIDYPGGSPKEVEEGITLAIEEQIRGLEGVKSLTSFSYGGGAIVLIKVVEKVNARELQQKISSKIDSIRSFPQEAERPIITLLSSENRVISLLIYGDQAKKTLKEVATAIKDWLAGIPGITKVKLELVPPEEIAVEVPLENMRKYNITLGEIANSVRNASLDLPAGEVDSKGGKTLLRALGKRNRAEDFKTIPLFNTENGPPLLLGDIATVAEVFENIDLEGSYNGKPAVRLDIYNVGNENPVQIAKRVREEVEKIGKELPGSIGIAFLDDYSKLFYSRFDLLIKNAIQGFFIILILLTLFIEAKLAFWVAVGIPTSLIGSFLFYPFVDFSLNMITLVAFIASLGVVVDDAILVGENIYEKRRDFTEKRGAAIRGCEEVAGAVILTVTTNILAVLPIFFLPGVLGKFFHQIPLVVISVMVVSLIESLFILPSHLAGEKRGRRGISLLLDIPNNFCRQLLAAFIESAFTPLLKASLRYRYRIIASSLALLFLLLFAFERGVIPFNLFPQLDSDVVSAYAILPYGAPIERSRKVEEILVKHASELLDDLEIEKNGVGIYSQIGTLLPNIGMVDPTGTNRGSHLVGVQIELPPPDEREVGGREFAALWKKRVGGVKEADLLTFTGILNDSGRDTLKFTIKYGDPRIVKQAAKMAADYLKGLKGVGEASEGALKGKPQLTYRLKEEAKALDLTTREFANQLRGAFYGAEALRQVQGREVMKVLVRLPEGDRRVLSSAENLILITPKKGEIAIAEAAEIEYGEADAVIVRERGKSIQSVTASLDLSTRDPNEVVNDFFDNFVPLLQSRFPGIEVEIGGIKSEEKAFLEGAFSQYLFVFLMLYSLFAITFKSYIQPLLIAFIIPFSAAGAIIAHLLLGMEVSSLSLVGIIPLAGIAVNDSLVLLLAINKEVKSGRSSLVEAAIEGAKKRFRPIILMSLTTFFGMAPLIFESSFQARTLAPIAVSLGFGILFATAVTLLFIPSLYLIAEDCKGAVNRMYGFFTKGRR